MPFRPILVVDDDSVSRHVIAQALAETEIPYLTAASAQEAMGCLLRMQPSLVLLDLVMPGADGFAVLRALRARAETKELPVVVLTALDTDEDVARAFESGADDFLRKPFRPVELVARIRSQLRLRQSVSDLDQKRRDSTLLVELTQKLATNLDFRSILFAVLQRIAAFVNVDRASIVLFGDDARTGYVVATSDDEHVRDLPIDLSNYPEMRPVFESRGPLVIRDVKGHPIFAGSAPEGAPGAFRSVALIPILFEGEPMGVLGLRTRHAQQFDARAIELCQIMANAMAIALRNARILQTQREQSEKVDEARAEAEKRLAVERALAHELEQTKRFLERVIAASVDAIISVDAKGTILLFNRAAERIFRRSAEAMVGADVRGLYPEGGARTIMRALRTAGGKVEGFLTEVIDGESERVPVAISATLLYEGDELVGSVGVLTDLREKNRMERQLEDAQARLLMRERQAAVIELAGAAAHELNQPLTSVLGYTELLKRRLDPTTPAFSAAQIIYSEVERMAEIVRKIGRMTRYETKDYVGGARIVDLDRASGERGSPSSRP